MNKLRWKQIFYVAKKEYAHWITSPKCILLFALFIPIREIIIMPIFTAANQMNQPVNILEPCIALVNSGLILLLLPLVYLLLMADFPCIDGNMLFLVSRVGRRNWIAGEILFQFLSLITYVVFIILGTMLQVSKWSFTVNAWSLVATDYDLEYANENLVGIASLLPPNLYYQMTPLKAFVLSYVLLLLSLFLWSGILFLGSLYAKKIIAFWLIFVNIVIGIALCALKTDWKWCFPISHTILWLHYQEYYRRYIFSPWMSILIFFGIIIIIYTLIIRKSGKINLDVLLENQ